MNQLHIGVGAQEIAPAALARMRLAGDEQNLQTVAHAFDCHDRLVVGEREFARSRRDLQLHDIGAAMLDAHRDIDDVAGHGTERRQQLAVPMHGNRGARAVSARVDNARANCLILPDDAKARRLNKLDAAITLLLAPRDERMQRRPEPERLGFGGDIVNDAVRNEYGGADAFRRNVLQRFGQRAKQFGAVIAAGVIRRADETCFHVGKPCERGLERLASVFGLRRPGPETLALALVDNDGDDAFLRIALLANKRRISKRRKQQRERERAQGGAALPARRAVDQRREADDAKRDQRGPRQERREGEREIAHGAAHWPSLSSRSRT